MLNRKLSLLHILVDCVLTCISKGQQIDKLDGIPHSVEIKAKVVYCCIGRSWKQSSSSKRHNNANGINDMAYMLWDIIASCESKHVWQMTNET